MHQPLEGIAAADDRLGRPFPLPQIALPLARWVEVTDCGSGAEVAWNLDDSRPGAPDPREGQRQAPAQLRHAREASTESFTPPPSG